MSICWTAGRLAVLGRRLVGVRAGRRRRPSPASAKRRAARPRPWRGRRPAPRSPPGRSPRTTAAAWQTGHQRQSEPCSPSAGASSAAPLRRRLEEPAALLDPVGTGVHEVPSLGARPRRRGDRRATAAESGRNPTTRRASGVPGSTSRPPVTSQRRSSASQPDRPAGAADGDHEVVDPAGQPDVGPLARTAAARSAATSPSCRSAAGVAAGVAAGRAKPASRPASSSTSAGGTACSAPGAPARPRRARPGRRPARRRGGPPTPPRRPAGRTRVSSAPAARPCSASVGDRRPEQPAPSCAAARRPGRRWWARSAGRGRAAARPAARRRAPRRSARVRGAGGDGGGPDGAQRPHPRRHQLVEPPAQRRRQRHERGHRLQRSGVQDDQVGLGPRELGEQREVARARDRHHRALRRQGQVRDDGAHGTGRAAQSRSKVACGSTRTTSRPATSSSPGTGDGLPGQQQRAPSGPRASGRRPPRPGSRCRPRRDRSGGACAPAAQPSTRFLSSLRAVSRMTFSARRFIMPSIGILWSMVMRVGHLGAAVRRRPACTSRPAASCIWPLTRVQETLRSPSQV